MSGMSKQDLLLTIVCTQEFALGSYTITIKLTVHDMQKIDKSEQKFYRSRDKELRRFGSRAFVSHFQLFISATIKFLLTYVNFLHNWSVAMSLTTIIVHDMFTVRAHTYVVPWLALSVGCVLGLECIYNAASNMNTLCDSALLWSQTTYCSALCSARSPLSIAQFD